MTTPSTSPTPRLTFQEILLDNSDKGKQRKNGIAAECTIGKIVAAVGTVLSTYGLVDTVLNQSTCRTEKFISSALVLALSHDIYVISDNCQRLLKENVLASAASVGTDIFSNGLAQLGINVSSVVETVGLQPVVSNTIGELTLKDKMLKNSWLIGPFYQGCINLI